MKHIASTPRYETQPAILEFEEAMLHTKLALESNAEFPEDFVRLLTLLYNECKDLRVQDAINRLIDAAFIHSAAFGTARDEFVNQLTRNIKTS